MESIIPIKGKVKFSITLDSGVWIFDDRKIDLTTYFEQEAVEEDQLEKYIEETSKHWSREIQEGATYPPTLKTEKKYEKEKVLTGTFGIPLKPFLENAEILEGATSVMIETTEEPITVSLEDACNIVLGFSLNGKPLKEDGPIHVYYGDGSNKENPITHVKGFNII